MMTFFDKQILNKDSHLKFKILSSIYYYAYGSDLVLDKYCVAVLQLP